MEKIRSPRGVIDRRALLDRLNARSAQSHSDIEIRTFLVDELKSALDRGRTEVRRRLEEDRGLGAEAWRADYGGKIKPFGCRWLWPR